MWMDRRKSGVEVRKIVGVRTDNFFESDEPRMKIQEMTTMRRLVGGMNLRISDATSAAHRDHADRPTSSSRT
jgi:hypothetical protein